MATTVENPESGKLTAPLAYLVDTSASDPVAIALIERGSIEENVNESDAQTEVHSQTDVIEDETTQQGETSMTIVRSEDDEALEYLGIRDDLNEGSYIRGSGREFTELEIWKFEEDIQPAEADVVHRDRFENVRVNFGSDSLDDETETFDITLKFEPVNDYYPGYEPSA